MRGPSVFVMPALILLSLGWTAQGHAQGLRFATNTSAPLDVEAGLMVWQRAAAQAQLSDKARLTQGPLTLSAKRMKIVFGQDGTAQNIEAAGQVVLVSAGDSNTPPRRATAETASIDLTGETIILSGNVVLQVESNDTAQVSAGQMALDMASGRTRLSGTADKPRARIELR